MKMATRIFRSSAARTFITVVSMVIHFFLLPFIVDKLGDRWYGIWTIITSLLSYYYLIDFGLATAVTRYVAKFIAQKDSENTNIVINTSLVIYSIMSGIIIIMTLALIYFTEMFIEEQVDQNIVRIVILISGTNFAIQFPFKAFAGIVGAYMRYDLLSLSHLLMVSLNAVLTVYFLSHGYGIVALALIGFGTAQLSYILFFLISRYLFSDLKVSLNFFRKDKVRELLGYSVWSFIALVSDQLRFKLSPMIIGGILSASTVTHYFIGARLAEYFLNLMLRATDILVPVFTKYHAEKNYNEIRSKLLFITRINAVIAVFGGGLIMVLGKALLIRWMGMDYLDAYPVLLTLMVAMIVETIMNPSKNVLFAIKKHKYFGIANFVEAAIIVTLIFILINFFGIWGVALGTCIPLVIVRIFFLLTYVCRSIKLSYREYILNITPTVIFTSAYLYIVYVLAKPYLINPTYFKMMAVSLLAGSVYSVSILFISFNKNERNLIKSMILPGEKSKL